MTVSVRTKPCELGWTNAITPYDMEETVYDYACSVTDRRQDAGNQIFYAEEASLSPTKTTMYTSNDKVPDDVEYTLYDERAHDVVCTANCLVRSV